MELIARVNNRSRHPIAPVLPRPGVAGFGLPVVCIPFSRRRQSSAKGAASPLLVTSAS
jgi:hypothetical protein